MRGKVVYLGAPVGFEAASRTLADGLRCARVETATDAVIAELRDAVAVLDASMKVRLTNDMLRTAEKLRVISCATTGADHIERDVLRKKNIPVHTLQEDKDILYSLTPAAELSWCLLMACARKLIPAAAQVRQGQWIRENFPGIMLNGKTIGIIGCGRIGSWVARYAGAFGMRVLGYDPYVKAMPAPARRATPDELLGESDFVSIHVPLNEETKGLLSGERIRMMKSGAILINTSRGAVVDQSALLSALESGRLAGAGLDVLDGEPDIADNPLVKYAREHDNLIITPHCGGFSPDAVAIVCERAASKINRYFE